jgi:multidrug efflux pump subunit AcrB
VDVLRSQTRPGESLITVLLKDYTPRKDSPGRLVPGAQEGRRHSHSLPQGVLGPFMNDEFGDTFITIYALTGDGFDLAALRQAADRIGRELQQLPDVKKIELFGVQERKDLHRGRARQAGDARHQPADRSSKRCGNRTP